MFNDCNWTRTQNHLVLKRTLNHLAKLEHLDQLKLLMSCFNCSKVRGQHKLRHFVQHLFFDEEHLIFDMMKASELHQFLQEIYLIKIIRKILSENRDIFYRSQFIFSKFLDDMLDLSFNFKQNIIHLFWAAFSIFLYTFGYQALQAQPKKG